MRWNMMLHYAGLASISVLFLLNFWFATREMALIRSIQLDTNITSTSYHSEYMNSLSRIFEKLDENEKVNFLNWWNFIFSHKQAHLRVKKSTTQIHFSTTREHLQYDKSDLMPNVEYEELRFRFYQNTMHLSNLVRWQISQILQKKAVNERTDNMSDLLRKLSELFNEYIRLNLKDISLLGDVDGFGNWRHAERENLQNLVQRRLNYLQNPVDFKNAKKLLCIPVTECGLTSHIHQVAHCLIAAYGSQRTMVLQTNWSQRNFTWLKIFFPAFKEYTLEKNISWSNWPGKETDQVLVFEGFYHTVLEAPYLPLYIPKDLAPLVFRTNLHPMAWWVGQFIKYLWRPRSEIQISMRKWQTSIGLKNPVVGLHIRRTDKIDYKEAHYFPVEDYMYHVEEFYKTYKLDHNVEEKRIYIATDDPDVYAEIREKYPNYKIIGDESIARTATPSNRDTHIGLLGALNDIHILSLTDFVVCDFSSNVCRLVYEMRQYQNKNAVYQFRSIGRLYDQFNELFKVIYEHDSSASWELELRVNDTIRFDDYLANGSSYGFNFRTKKLGIYPAIKVIPLIGTYDFPTYPQVPYRIVKS